LRPLLFVAAVALLPLPVAANPPPVASPAPAASPATLASPTTLLLPAGTSVAVSFVQSVSSDSNTEGSQQAVEVTKEVDIDGMMVIAKGAQGQATLTKVLHSGGNGSGGKVQFNVDWVYSVDGGKVALSAVDNTTPNADRKGEASTLGILGYATFGLLGLFGHNLAHGNAAVIKPETVFTVFVDQSVHVASTSPATAAPGFDH
jgi:hypothetical protein